MGTRGNLATIPNQHAVTDACHLYLVGGLNLIPIWIVGNPSEAGVPPHSGRCTLGNVEVGWRQGAFPPDDCTVEPPVPVEIPQWRSRPRRHAPAALPPTKVPPDARDPPLIEPPLAAEPPTHLSQRASHRSLTSHHSRSRRRCSTRPCRGKTAAVPAPAPLECHLSPRSRQHRLPSPLDAPRATRNARAYHTSALRCPARCRGTAARSCARRSTTQRVPCGLPEQASPSASMATTTDCPKRANSSSTYLPEVLACNLAIFLLAHDFQDVPSCS